MKTNFERISEWNTKMGVKKGNPNNYESVKLGVDLVEEELREVYEEIFDQFGDIKEDLNMNNLSKEIGDLLFVVYGLAHRLGINADLAASRVTDSNDSKFCSTVEEAIETQKHYRQEKGVDTYFDKVGNDGQFAVYRSSDNKVLKPVCYQGADMYGCYNLEK